MCRENNKDIRCAAKNAGVLLWEIANKLGIHDSALSRKLRRELPPEEKEKVLGIIAELAAERTGVA